ncbi:hypothetical protein OB13_12935 [Pontibacter sp. HJ8]
MNDFGQLPIMPVTHGDKFRGEAGENWFSHKAEVTKPYYFSVYLAGHAVTAELMPTERAAQLRFTYPRTGSSFSVIDAPNKGAHLKLIPSEKKHRLCDQVCARSVAELRVLLRQIGCKESIL